MKELLDILSEYKSVDQGVKLNQFSTKPNELKFNDLDVKKFNKLLDLLEASDLCKIIRTKSGGIAVGKKGLNNYYAWDLEVSKIGCRITVIIEGEVWVFKLGKVDKQAPGIYPDHAFACFYKMCTDKGIDLAKYKITNGKEVKETISSPLIEMKYKMSVNDLPLEHVHHVDFHSSYPAGLANTHPEFRPIIEKLYEERSNPEYGKTNKAILNYTIGWMQSYNPEKHRYADWANLSKDAIDDNNLRILKLTIMLEASGREVIGYNTDGIWYKGDIFHGEGEGLKLGEWSHDYINCNFRSKSDGAYEFIGYDVKARKTSYKAVVRGILGYDLIVTNRDDWKWGDIYKGGVIQYYYNKETRRIEKREEV